MSRRNAANRKKTVLFVVGVVVVFLIIRGILAISAYIPLLYQFAFNKDINLVKTNDHVNVLLLGIGGGNHDGPNLTDTIILASIDTKTKRVTLVSVPRDLWVSELHQKINTAYAIGEGKQKGDGLILAKAVVQKVVGQPIDYGFRIDFAGFEQAVDLVGGLNIAVENTFDDYQYPIEGQENNTCGHTQEEVQQLATASSELDAFPCRYMHIHFDKGSAHMNGKTTLEYVRSRHAAGIEGSDFARSKREEKVITAFKDKVFSVETIFNPGELISLYSVLKNSIDTDIKIDEIDDFYRLAQKVKGTPIKSYVLDTGDEQTGRQGLLSNPIPSAETDYAWALYPRVGNGDYSEIHTYVACAIVKDSCPVTSITPPFSHKNTFSQ